MEAAMKKTFAIFLAFFLLLSSSACAKNTGFIEKEITPDIKWTDGIAFQALSPNTEQRNLNTIVITEKRTDFAYSITYARTGLTLYCGLVSEDGKEYAAEITGGTDRGFIKGIPEGTYYLFVRNSDYAEYESYQNGTVNYDANGVLNYAILEK